LKEKTTLVSNFFTNNKGLATHQISIPEFSDMLRVKKLSETAVLPVRGSVFAAGMYFLDSTQIFSLFFLHLQ
jgi:hypothetical protein